jgi:hypothetical protein
MIEAISKWQLANSEPFKDLPQSAQRATKEHQSLTVAPFFAWSKDHTPRT